MQPFFFDWDCRRYFIELINTFRCMTDLWALAICTIHTFLDRKITSQCGNFTASLVGILSMSGRGDELETPLWYFFILRYSLGSILLIEKYAIQISFSSTGNKSCLFLRNYWRHLERSFEILIPNVSHLKEFFAEHGKIPSERSINLSEFVADIGIKAACGDWGLLSSCSSWGVLITWSGRLLSSCRCWGV